MVRSLAKAIASRLPLDKISIGKGFHDLVQPLFKKNGYELEVREFGDRKIGYWSKSFSDSASPKRLVVIPGFGDSPLSWFTVTLPLQKAIGHKYDEVIFLDFPGFQGFLSDELAFDSMDQLMSATCQLLDELQPHTVMGHSLGGWLSSEYALRLARGKCHNERAKRFILISPPSLIPKIKQMVDWKKKFVLARTEGLKEFGRFLFVKEPLWFQFMAAEFDKFFGKREIQDFMDSIGRPHFINGNLDELSHEITMVWGDQDELNLTSWLDGWRNGIDQKKTGPMKSVLVHGVGHNLHIENPVVTAKVIGKILLNHGLGHSQAWTVK